MPLSHFSSLYILIIFVRDVVIRVWKEKELFRLFPYYV